MWVWADDLAAELERRGETSVALRLRGVWAARRLGTPLAEADADTLAGLADLLTGAPAWRARIQSLSAPQSTTAVSHSKARSSGT